MDLFNQIVTDLQSIDHKIEDEDKTLMLLCLLSECYENFVDTMLYSRLSITLEDITAVLNLKELKKRVMEGSSDMTEGLLARGRFENGCGSKGRTMAKSHE